MRAKLLFLLAISMSIFIMFFLSNSKPEDLKKISQETHLEEESKTDVELMCVNETTGCS